MMQFDHPEPSLTRYSEYDKHGEKRMDLHIKAKQATTITKVRYCSQCVLFLVCSLQNPTQYHALPQNLHHELEKP